VSFRGNELAGAYTGFSDRPAYADARAIADDLMAAYLDGRLDRVDIVYNAYVSPLTQRVTREGLLPLSRAPFDPEQAAPREAADTGAGAEPPAAVDYEPDAKEILKRLVPDFVEISIYRALVESAAGFFGAQMTAMRSASDNAGEILTDYTLQMNRARQAEITQEIMEVVAGAEGLSYAARAVAPSSPADLRQTGENKHNGPHHRNRIKRLTRGLERASDRE
jgi:F-type H+-transporting ATPase subunit gamma